MLNMIAFENYLRFHASGENKTIPIKRLAYLFGVSRRSMEQATERLRQEGVLLCSRTKPPGGLFIAETLEEFMSWDRQIDSRIREMIIHRAQMRKTARLVFTDAEQLSLKLNYQEEVHASS